MKRTILTLLSITSLSLTTQAADEITVYSHRHYEVDQQLFAKFTADTGIKVNVVNAGADALIARLTSEGKNSPADVFMTADAGHLHRAKTAGVLQPTQSAFLEKAIPAHLRDPDGNWFALTVRARVLIYNKAKLAPAQLSTYEDLTDPKWKNRVVARSSSNIYNQSLLASIIDANGRDAALTWAKGVRANMARPPRGSDRDQIRAVAAGLADVAIANTYYLGLLKTSSDPKDKEVFAKVAPFFPNQANRGTHINASGAGVTASSDNKAAATKLIEFLASPEAQQVFGEANFEFPVNPQNNKNELLKSWGTFKADAVNLDVLGKNNAAAVKIFNEAGWE